MATSLTAFSMSAPTKPGGLANCRDQPRRRWACPRMNTEDGLASRISGWSRTTRRSAARDTQQRRVEDVGPVGGGDHNHVGIGIKTVHLDQNLVEGLFSFVV